MVALVVPSVTYAPKRPSLILIGLPLSGSASNSFSALDAARPPYFGWAYSSIAPAKSMSKISSSLGSERVSVPFFRYGPKRPFCAVISASVSGSSPTTRGRSSNRKAVSRSRVARSIDLKIDAVRCFTTTGFFTAGFRFGLAAIISPVNGSITSAAAARAAAASAATSAAAVAAASAATRSSSVTSGTGSASVMYGPKRPSFAKTSFPLSGLIPTTRSTTTGASMSSRAFAAVSSSGASASGMFTRRGFSGSSLGASK